jgi:hypothetical protein
MTLHANDVHTPLSAVHIDESVPSGGFVVDRWSLDFMQPEEDEQQNVWLKSFVRRPDGGFRAMIERPLDSCDPQV